MQYDDLIEAAHRRYRQDASRLPPGHIAPIPDSGGYVISPPERPQPGEKIKATFIVLTRIDGRMIDHLAVYRVEGDRLEQATDEEFAEAGQGAQSEIPATELSEGLQTGLKTLRARIEAGEPH
jgi:hypothetical protein